MRHVHKPDPSPLEAHSSSSILDMELPPIRFILDGVIPFGLTVIAGPPKIGKSSFNMQLSESVAEGKPQWEMKTIQGTTLYLCLEDTLPRIQHRLRYVTEDGSESAMYAIEACSIGSGLEEQITAFVKDHPHTVLVMIDTLQKVRPANHESTYALDYQDLCALKALADKLTIAIIVVHHTRKKDSDDPQETVSGTLGITGVADTSLVFRKIKGRKREVELYCTGRDIAERILHLKLNPDNIWEYLGELDSEPEEASHQVIDKVVRFMQNRIEFKGRPSELAEELSAGSAIPLSAQTVGRELENHGHQLSEFGLQIKKGRSNGIRTIHISHAIGSASADSDAFPSPAGGAEKVSLPTLMADA